jgi:hypothetical protein
MIERMNQKIFVTKVIRSILKELPEHQVFTTKPRSILPELEKRNIVITPSVRSIISKLLSEFRKSHHSKKYDKITHMDIVKIAAIAQKRSDLAIEVLKACDFNFDVAIMEIERIKEIAFSH